MKHLPYTLPSGAVLQSAVEKGQDSLGFTGRAFGLNFRGFVVKLYPRDAPPVGTANPASTYADVKLYGKRNQLLPRVQVPQAYGSPHTGVVGGLRAATMGSGAAVVDLDHINPAEVDASHVVVSFLDDDLAQPYISAVLEHPRADGGGPVAGPVEDRVRLAAADGRPLLLRWNGITVGMSAAGDLLVDLEHAYDGTLVGDGAEPPPPTDGMRGNAQIRVADGARMLVSVGGVQACTIDISGGAARLVLGDGAWSAAAAQPLRELYDQLKAEVDALRAETAAHTHLVVIPPAGAPGPSGPASTGTPGVSGAPGTPAWDVRIESDRLKIPETT